MLDDIARRSTHFRPARAPGLCSIYKDSDRVHVQESEDLTSRYDRLPSRRVAHQEVRKRVRRIAEP
jgi:hypothetical protein